MAFFKPRFRSYSAQERLNIAQAVLASDEDGARLLALAAQHQIEFSLVTTKEGGAYGGLGLPLKMPNHDDLASYVMTLAHELRHLEQDIAFGLFDQRYRLKPAEHALLMRMVEADAYAFSAAVVHKLLKNGKLQGAFRNNRLYMEQRTLKKFFAAAAQKKTLQTASLADVYRETASHFSKDGLYYDYRSLQLYSFIRMSPEIFEAKLPPGTVLLQERLEDIFAMNASIPLPGGTGKITLSEMLESAAATIQPRMYVLFAQLDRSPLAPAQPGLTP